MSGHQSGSSTCALVTMGLDDTVAPGLGRAALVAISVVQNGRVAVWHEHHVGWDTAHDEGTAGSHHARIARFLREHEVDVVVTGKAGAGMRGGCRTYRE